MSERDLNEEQHGRIVFGGEEMSESDALSLLITHKLQLLHHVRIGRVSGRDNQLETHMNDPHTTSVWWEQNGHLRVFLTIHSVYMLHAKEQEQRNKSILFSHANHQNFGHVDLAPSFDLNK